MEGGHGEESLYRQGLCDTCQKVIDAVDNDNIWFLPFYQNSSLMKQSAKNGCLLCGQFLALIEAQQLEEPVHIDGIYLNRPCLHWRDEADDSDDLRSRHRTKRVPQWIGEYQLSLNTKDKHQGLVVLNFLDQHGGPVDIKRSRKDSLPLIKQWLNTCSAKHNCANSIPGKPFLPTRLVYTKGSTPRLCLAVDILGSWKYATLSHCWGTLKSVTLSQSNIDSFKKEIPSAALTQTFKDAIEVAQALGIDYIWIDSLCIIQDKDSNDWAAESAQMSEVYGNSHLNIAATSALDGRYGLFQVGKEHRNKSFRAWKSDKSKSYHCIPPDMYKKSILEAPLMRRAWVVQERLLSSRTVHFTSTQVFWECGHGTACEAYPLGMPEDQTFTMSGHSRYIKKSLLEYRWDHIVQLYTGCSLTFGQDKLPGISGVAEAMKIFKKCDYVAGLWIDDSLLLQLCWRVKSDRSPRPKYRAPSWSWAAVDSPITYSPTEPGHKFRPCVEILCFGTAAINLGYLEEASGLPLVLKCEWLCPATLEAIAEATKMGYRGNFDYLDQNMGDLYFLSIAELRLFNLYDEIGCLILEKTWIKQGQYRRVGCTGFVKSKLNELEGYQEFQAKLTQGNLEERDLLPRDCYIKDLRSEKSRFIYQIEII